jgi:DNA-binding IscR family transcriptional regulator
VGAEAEKQLDCDGSCAIPRGVDFAGSRVEPVCGSLLFMAKSGRFGLSLRILMVLAEEPDTMQPSAAIAEKLAQSAVMVRRCFLLLHKRGLIEQRKGPNGGARLKLPAKQIGLGDIYAASEDNWLGLDEPAIAGLLKRAREDGVQAMNETTLAQVMKRIRKNASAAKAADGEALNKTTAA